MARWLYLDTAPFPTKPSGDLGSAVPIVTTYVGRASLCLLFHGFTCYILLAVTPPSMDHSYYAPLVRRAQHFPLYP